MTTTPNTQTAAATEANEHLFMFASNGLSYSAYAHTKEQAASEIRKECGPFPLGLLYIGMQ